MRQSDPGLQGEEALNDVRIPGVLMVSWTFTGIAVVLAVVQLVVAAYASTLWFDDASALWLVVALAAVGSAGNVMAGVLLPAVVMIRSRVGWQQALALASSVGGGAALLGVGGAAGASWMAYWIAEYQTHVVVGRPATIRGECRRAQACIRDDWI